MRKQRLHITTETDAPSSTSWTVTWWAHDTRQSQAVADEEAAHASRDHLRQQSDAMTEGSLVPIRIMPSRVFAVMHALSTSKEDAATRVCRHHCLQRLCLPCVSEPHS